MATATITYGGRNKLARSVMDFIRSLDVFTVTETPKRKVTKDRVSQCISVAMISSLMILVITIICTFSKKIGLPKSILYHVFIVFSM